MSAPVGAIFYFELKYGNTKGQVTAGQKLIQNFNPNYSAQYIDGETIGTGDGHTQTFSTHVPAWAPVIAGSFTVTAGTVVGQDDGSGNITGTGITTGTIDYTGATALSVTFTVAPVAGTVITSTYQYNSEGSSTIPTVNIDIALVAVTAKSRKIKALWSSEAADDLKALHGVKEKLAA